MLQPLPPLGAMPGGVLVPHFAALQEEAVAAAMLGAMGEVAGQEALTKWFAAELEGRLPGAATPPLPLPHQHNAVASLHAAGGTGGPPGAPAPPPLQAAHLAAAAAAAGQQVQPLGLRLSSVGLMRQAAALIKGLQELLQVGWGGAPRDG